MERDGCHAVDGDCVINDNVNMLSCPNCCLLHAIIGVICQRDGDGHSCQNKRYHHDKEVIVGGTSFKTTIPADSDALDMYVN